VQRIRQFYSRRIGEIDWGAKATGTVGSYDFIALGTQAQLDGLDADYGAFRLQKAVMGSGNVGLLAASRRLEGDNAGSVGLDATTTGGSSTPISPVAGGFKNPRRRSSAPAPTTTAITGTTLGFGYDNREGRAFQIGVSRGKNFGDDLWLHEGELTFRISAAWNLGYEVTHLDLEPDLQDRRWSLLSFDGGQFPGGIERRLSMYYPIALWTIRMYIYSPMAENTVTASELKTKSAQVLDRVVQSRAAVIITRRGRAIAKLVPMDERPDSLFGIARGSVTVLGDIVEPIDVTWEASR